MSKAISKKDLFQSISSLIKEAQQHVVRNINTTMLITYFEIGRMIVEDELKGEQRAGYAEKTLHQLSLDLTKEFGKGYSVDNLERFRRFYTTYQNRISAAAVRKSEIIQSAIGQSSFPFSLSWIHYIQLLKIGSEDERNFYEIEAAQNNWSVRELTRQLE